MSTRLQKLSPYLVYADEYGLILIDKIFNLRFNIFP